MATKPRCVWWEIRTSATASVATIPGVYFDVTLWRLQLCLRWPKNRYFKRKLDIFSTTTKCFLCLNLCRAQAQRPVLCHNPKQRKRSGGQDDLIFHIYWRSNGHHSETTMLPTQIIQFQHQLEDRRKRDSDVTWLFSRIAQHNSRYSCSPRTVVGSSVCLPMWQKVCAYILLTSWYSKCLCAPAHAQTKRVFRGFPTIADLNAAERWEAPASSVCKCFIFF